MISCHDVRAELSAALDGEADLDAGPAEVRDHLLGCAECARWLDEAAQLNRLLRITDGPDLTDSILAQVRLPHRGRWRTPARIALAVVALAQLTIGLMSLFAPVGMASSTAAGAHMDHEEAAFNIAFGIALVTVAWNGRRASTQVPVLATFVLVLVVSSTFDLLEGNVTWTRLVTHLPILLGLVLSASLGRMSRGEPDPQFTGLRAPSWPARRATGTVRSATAPVESRSRQSAPPAARRHVA
jgi:predicted anti-sigma-YlaC factor YlaD